MVNKFYVVDSPLRVPTNKSENKFFVLNMNQYRNTHYHVLNTAKIKYKELISTQLVHLPNFTKIKLSYKLFPKDKRLCDLDNVIAVHAKFFQDALVETNHLEEDNYNFITKSTYSFGSIDKLNPRVEITIEEIT